MRYWRFYIYILSRFIYFAFRAKWRFYVIVFLSECRNVFCKCHVLPTKSGFYISPRSPTYLQRPKNAICGYIFAETDTSLVWGTFTNIKPQLTHKTDKLGENINVIFF